MIDLVKSHFEKRPLSIYFLRKLNSFGEDETFNTSFIENILTLTLCQNDENQSRGVVTSAQAHSFSALS